MARWKIGQPLSRSRVVEENRRINRLLLWAAWMSLGGFLLLGMGELGFRGALLLVVAGKALFVLAVVPLSGYLWLHRHLG